MISRFLISIFLIVLMNDAIAADPAITYHGRLLKSNGKPVLSSTQFRMQIVSPGNEACVLYEETISQDLSQSEGAFSLILNGGYGTRSDSNVFSFESAFSNRAVLSAPGNCATGSTYTPNPKDGRALKIYFNDGTGWDSATVQQITYVPKAIDSYQIGGYTADSLLKVLSGGVGTDPATNITPLTNTDYTDLMALIGGTSTKYTKQGSNGTSALPVLGSAPASPSAGQMWLQAGSIKFYDGASTQTLGTSGGGGTFSSTVTVSSGGINNSGGLNNNSGNITNAGSITGVGTNLTGSSALTVASGGSNQTLALNSTGTAAVNVATGSGTGLSVIDSGATNVNYVTIKGAAASNAPVIATAGTDANINLILSPKGTGNIGIGTSSPTATLETLNATAGKTSFKTVGVNGSLLVDNVGSGENYYNASSFHAFQIGGVEKMRMTSGGTIGIGTSTPTGTLTVQSTNNASVIPQVWVESNQNNSGIALNNTQAGGRNWELLSTGGSAGIASSYRVYDVTSGLTPFVINSTDAVGIGGNITNGSLSGASLVALSSGNIGVGTISPQSLLNIVGAPTASTQRGLVSIGNGGAWDGTGGSFLGSASGTVIASNASSGYTGNLIDLQVNGSSKFKVDATGNLTITGTLGNSSINWGTPGTIGSTTPSTGAFSTLSSTGYSQASGNFDQSSSTGTFATGTGAVSLNGSTTIAANRNLAMTSGTGTFTQTYSGSGTAHSITGIASGNLLDLITSSTSAGTGDKALNIAVSGANGTGGVIRYGAYSNVTSTGGTSTNVGGYFSASGATNNYGLLVPNGNVGIGTTSPGNKISLSGSTTASVGEFIDNTNTAGYSVLRLNSGNVDAAVGGALHAMGSTYPSTGAYAPNVTALTGFDSGGLNLTAQNASGNLRFFTGGALVSNERMRIDASGNVGIGTTSPSTLLHMRGANAVHRIDDTNGTSSSFFGSFLDAAQFSVNRNPSTGTFTDPTKAAAQFSINGSSGDSSFLFYTSTTNGAIPTERMRINGSGNVGIGTTTPSASLDVANGNYSPSTSPAINIGADLSAITRTDATRKIGFMTSSHYTNAQPQFSLIGGDSTSANNTMNIGGGSTGYNSATRLLFFTGGTTTTVGGTEKMRIDSSGNVGIGTTSPFYNLEVQRTTNDAAARVLSTTAGAWLYLDSASDGWAGVRIPGTIPWSLGKLFGSTDFSISNTINGSSLRYFNIQAGTGNVGIGTTTPGYKLDVQGGGVNTSGVYTNVSDRRLKENIETIPSESALDQILKLRPVNYYWKNKKDDASKQVGFIAQEVESVIPELVKTDSRGFKSMNYSQLVSPIVGAIKELYAKFKALLDRADTQDRVIAELKAEKSKEFDQLRSEKTKEIEQLRSEKSKEISELKAKNETLASTTKGLIEKNKALEERLNRLEKALDAK